MTETIKERGRTRLGEGALWMFSTLFRYVGVKEKFSDFKRLERNHRVFVTMFNLPSVSVPQHHETTVKL